MSFQRLAATSEADVLIFGHTVDFLDLGSRDAVDKALQRLVSGGRLRRLDRSLYDTPRINRLTKRCRPSSALVGSDACNRSCSGSI